MLVIVSKEFVGYLLAAIGPIALGKIYDVCHSWTMPLVLLQAGDTVVFKDLYRFTREAENGYKKKNIVLLRNTWNGSTEVLTWYFLIIQR